MTGFSDAQEVAILNTAYGSTLYLRILTGTAGQTVNDNGTLPGGCTEVTGLTCTSPDGTLANAAIPGTYWNGAIAGSPTTKSVPRSAKSPITLQKTSSWTTCGYCWTTDANTISSSNLYSSGIWVDVNAAALVKSVSANSPFNITSTSPIIERMGDPPTAGTVNPNPT